MTTSDGFKYFLSCTVPIVPSFCLIKVGLVLKEIGMAFVCGYLKGCNVNISKHAGREEFLLWDRKYLF